jgi:hypothetical protein
LGKNQLRRERAARTGGEHGFEKRPAGDRQLSRMIYRMGFHKLIAFKYSVVLFATG